MARKFFYVCAGMFLLALSYHFGASTATAQAPGNQAVALGSLSGYQVVLTAGGDIYWSPNGSLAGPWALGGNVFGGAPVPTQHESWGQVKARYRNAPGVPVTPGADSR